MALELTLLFVFLIVLIASILSGAAGFGFGLISIPALLLVYDPVTVITIGRVVAVVMAVVIMADTWRHVAFRTVVGLIPASLLGTVLGVAVLDVLSAGTIKLIASLVALLFAFILIQANTSLLPATPWLTGLVGLISGTLSTSTGLPGPPVVLLFTARGMAAPVFRGSIAAYFVVLNAGGLLALLAPGVAGREELLVAITVSPVAVLGTWIGQRLGRRVSQSAFRRFTLGLLIVTATAGAVSALLALLR
ncbi:MAG: sulfite exporter TauE/SafE family protein [Thermomicrobiales bacterium]